MFKNNYFNIYSHLFIYLFCALFYSFAIDISAPDDGLRHISFALNKQIMQSWGNVYPHSLFGNYDPWFMWHNLLSIVHMLLPYEKFYVAINTFSLFFLMLFSHEFIKRYVKYDFSSLLYILVFILCMLTSYRYVMIRPDLLSGLFIMLALLLKNRFFPIFILSLLYIPFYYLFFIYTGSVALVYLVQNKLKSFFGVFIGSLFGLTFHLLYDFNGYTTTVYNILMDQKLRMGLAVIEGEPLFSFLSGINYFLLLSIFLFVSFLLIWLKYDYFKKNSLALFLLITSILWVNQYRYYHLFLPLIFIFIFTWIVNLNKKKMFYILRKYLILLRRYFDYSKNKKIFYLIVIPYSIFMLSYIFSSQSLTKKVKEENFFKKNIFQYKTILSNKMSIDMFVAHYNNPTIKFIPSCSIGWFENKSPKMKKLYVSLLNYQKQISEEELKELIDYTNSDYYLHYMMNPKQKFNFDKLISLGIIPVEINSLRILFKVRKN